METEESMLDATPQTSAIPLQLNPDLSEDEGLELTCRSETTEEGMPYVSPHSQQISLAQYNREAQSYTQAALRQLKASEEYKQHTQRCHR